MKLVLSGEGRERMDRDPSELPPNLDFFSQHCSLVWFDDIQINKYV